MNYIRIILFSIVTYVAFGQVAEQITSAFSRDEVIKVDGLLNIWGSYASFLVGLYVVVYSVKEQFNLSLNIGEINKVLIFSCLLIAPLLSVGTYSQSKENISSYVECKNERELSSRYSSRTYAVNEGMCKTTITLKK